MRKMNKRGEEKILSIWNVVIWAVVALGIVLAVFVFYSAYLDVRKIEAEILSSRIVDCISGNGYLKPDIFKEGYDLLDDCNLDKERIIGDYYINVSIYDFNSCLFSAADGTLKCPAFVASLAYGNPDFATQCLIRESSKAKRFALCDKKVFYALGKSDDNFNQLEYFTEIITASNQEEGG